MSSSKAMDEATVFQEGYTHKFVICFYEFLGTAMLVLGYNFTNAGLAVAFNLFIGILMAGKVSGGMFNPAVTIAVYLSRGELTAKWKLVIMTILSQVVGAYFGIIYAHFVIGYPAFLCPFDQATGCISPDTQYFKVFLLEFWCTFFFCICILCEINSDASESRDGVLKAAAIAMTLYAMITTAGAISGGCFNPAFGFTQTTYQVGYMNYNGY